MDNFSAHLLFRWERGTAPFSAEKSLPIVLDMVGHPVR